MVYTSVDSVHFYIQPLNQDTLILWGSGVYMAIGPNKLDLVSHCSLHVHTRTTIRNVINPSEPRDTPLYQWMIITLSVNNKVINDNLPASKMKNGLMGLSLLGLSGYMCCCTLGELAHLHNNPEVIICLLVSVEKSSQETDNVGMLRVVLENVQLGFDVLFFVQIGFHHLAE